MNILQLRYIIGSLPIANPWEGNPECLKWLSMPNNYDILNCIICSNNNKHIFNPVSKRCSAKLKSELQPPLFAEKPKEEKLSAPFVSVFFDAEGTFIISIFRRTNFKVGWQVKPNIKISLHIKDLHLLQKIQAFFCGIGVIYKASYGQSAYFEVRSFEDLTAVIIPHFYKYHLLTPKRADFILFKSVIELMSRKEHQTPVGLQKIVTFFYIKIKNLYPFLLRRGDIYIYIK
jgi:hypothetical protein